MRIILFILIFFPLKCIYGQQCHDSLLESLSDDEIADFIHDCSRNNRWLKLSFLDLPKTSYDTNLLQFDLINDSLKSILNKYTRNDTPSYRLFHYVNMCHYGDSSTPKENEFDMITIRYIHSPSSIDECKGFFIYRSGCFFIQSGFDEFIEPTNRKKKFHIDKYPEVYLDEEPHIDYYIYKDGKFCQYYSH